MNYVKKFNFFGVEARQLPSVTGEGKPTSKTDGEVGEIYMDTGTGKLWKCVEKTDTGTIWVDVTAGLATEDFVEKKIQSALNDNGGNSEDVETTTLDSIAWGDLTYRDIFVNGNLTPWGNMEFDNLTDAAIHAGTPAITTESSFNGTRSLKCSDSGAQLIKGVFASTEQVGSVYLACKVKIESYTSGARGVGVQYFNDSSGVAYQTQITGVTDGYVTVSVLGNVNRSLVGTVYVGAFGTDINATAYIDDVVFVSLSQIFGENVPTKEELDTMYDIYLSINPNTVDDSVIENIFTDEECTTAFMRYMAEKAEVWEMNDTYFANPSGLTEESYSTPQDLLKLGLVTCSNENANKVWGRKSISLKIAGVNERELLINHSVITSAISQLTPYYDFLGGKSGSLTRDTYYRNQVLVVDINNKPTVISIMAKGETSYNAIINIAKDIADMVKAKIEGNTTTESSRVSTLITDGGGYAACVLPQNSHLYNCNYSPSKLLTREYSISNAPSVSSLPASTTKIMTMLCSFDYVNNMNEVLTIKQSDIVGGSGSTYYEGDNIRFIDAVTAMMLESSNTLANAVARFAGEKILQSQILAVTSVK